MGETPYVLGRVPSVPRYLNLTLSCLIKRYLLHLQAWNYLKWHACLLGLSIWWSDVQFLWPSDGRQLKLNNVH